MFQSADPREQVIAELRIRVERLEAGARVERPEMPVLEHYLPLIESQVDAMLVAG